eukprot:TRINITY_DN5120_c0_g1_i1.p1 TRINITY_DN5120_c0_g1~~TRINITY_DN5120_c0_g1_i1.p1  ORF type:complete len:366 (+),score=56.89 TRINITY_DN5120_c0_g1_i1:144-1241(+)
MIIFAITSDFKRYIAIVKGITIGLQVVLNLLFLIAYKKILLRDPEFYLWTSTNSFSSSFIFFFSSLFSFQTFRLLYSRPLGCDVFAVRFNDFETLFKTLNRFSVVQLVLVQSFAMIFDLVNLVLLPYGTLSYIFMTESCVLSFLLVFLLGCAIKTTDATIAALIKEIKSAPLNNVSMINTPTLGNINAEEDKSQNENLKTKYPFKNPNEGLHSRGSVLDPSTKERNKVYQVAPPDGKSSIYDTEQNLVAVPSQDYPSASIIEFADASKAKKLSRKNEGENLPTIIDNNATLFLPPNTSNNGNNKNQDYNKIVEDSKSEFDGQTNSKKSKKNKDPLERISEAAEREEESQYHSKAIDRKNLGDVYE